MTKKNHKLSGLTNRPYSSSGIGLYHFDFQSTEIIYFNANFVHKNNI